MKKQWIRVVVLLSVVVLGLSLWGCGGSSTRYDPGAPSAPTKLTAVAGNNQVALSWAAASKAAGYVVYYSTSSGVNKTTGTKFTTTTSPSVIVTGLTNGTPYYFVVTSVNSNSESAESIQVSAEPSSLRSFSQSDLAGTWNFNILVSGNNAKWMRGTLTVTVDQNNDSTVNIGSFLDSGGATTAPAGLLSALYVDAVGQVQDVKSGTPTFKGVMAGNTYKDLIVGTDPNNSASPMIVILQKRGGTSFAINGGFPGGSSGTKSRRFIYNQVTAGVSSLLPGTWEYAEGKINTSGVASFTKLIKSDGTSSVPSQTNSMSVNSSGDVTETSSSPTQLAVIGSGNGTMSTDNTLIVATGNDLSGRPMLRIYQIVNLSSVATIYSDLSGFYNMNSIDVTNKLTASSSLLVSTLSGAFSSYLDSTGSTANPLPSLTFSLAAASSGASDTVLTDSGDLHGKLSLFHDMLVFTKTVSSGFGLYVGVK